MDRVLAKYQVVAITRKRRYREMFRKIFDDFDQMGRGESKQHWLDLIDQVIKKLKRDDRIIWYLRNAQNMHALYRNKRNWIFQVDPTFTGGSGGTLGVLEHYISNAEVNGYQSVLDYQFRRQSAQQLLGDLRALTEKEEEKKGAKQRLIERQPEDITFERFPDGWEWHLLDRPSCEKEGAAMRHCGNRGATDKGQRILSLREPVKTKSRKILWKPHATFIWNKDGSLGEMKGFANEKPDPKTHPYIIELLKHKKITQLRGGGYAAKNNFRVSDLAPEMQKHLSALRPDLASSNPVDLKALAKKLNEWITFRLKEKRDPEESEDVDYLDADIRRLRNLDSFTDEAKELIEKIKLLDTQHWHQVVNDSIDIKYNSGIWASDNRIDYVNLGTTEIYLPEDEAETVRNLNEEDFETLDSMLDYGSFNDDRDTIILELHDEFFDAILNEKTLDDSINAFLDEKFETDISKTVDKMLEKGIQLEWLADEPEWVGKSYRIYYTDPKNGKLLLYEFPLKEKLYMAKFLYELKEEYKKLA